MKIVERLPYMFLIVLSVVSVVFAQFIGQEQISMVFGWKTFTLSTSVLFLVLAVLSALSAALYFIFRRSLFSTRWMWLHVVSLVVFLLAILLHYYSSKTLISLEQLSNAQREAYDDYTLVRVVRVSQRGLISCILCQLILPFNIALGWFKARDSATI